MKSYTGWIDAVAVAALVLAVGYVITRTLPPPSGVEPIAAGTPLPTLTTVEGWLNVEGAAFRPDADSLLVVDCWASWCGPCRAEMPSLAKLVHKYQSRGVQFIGLTSETDRDLPKIEEFMATVDGYDWPVGYGAGTVMDELDVPGFPTLIVFDANDQVAWSGFGSSNLASALERLLAQRGL